MSEDDLTDAELEEKYPNVIIATEDDLLQARQKACDRWGLVWEDIEKAIADGDCSCCFESLPEDKQEYARRIWFIFGPT